MRRMRKRGGGDRRGEEQKARRKEDSAAVNYKITYRGSRIRKNTIQITSLDIYTYIFLLSEYDTLIIYVYIYEYEYIYTYINEVYILKINEYVASQREMLLRTAVVILKGSGSYYLQSRKELLLTLAMGIIAYIDGGNKYEFNS